MLKIRTRGGAPSGLRRRGRSARSVAAILTTSLLAPAAIATVATTAVSTWQAAPAAAAPGNYVVAGDADSRNTVGPGAWTFHGADYSELRALITNTANFGPSGTVNARFTIGSPITTITDAALAGVDVYFSGAIPGSDNAPTFYTPAERTALRAFVQRGGILIINQNSSEWNTGQVIGEADGNSVTQQFPPAYFSPASANDGGAPGLAGGFEAPYKPTNGSTPAEGAGRAVAGAPLIDGPFGTVTSYSMWHTVAGFTSIPTGAVVNARVQSACDIASTGCANPTTPPQPPVVPPTCDSDPSATLPDCPREFNNNLNNLTSLATMAPGSSLTGLGGVVLTSDVDTYANHSEYNSGAMKAGNRTLALNTFAWAANILNTNNPAPTAQGYTSLTSPVRVLNTRDGIGGPAGLVAGGSARTIQVAGVNGVPANATAVALNVTASDADNATFVSVFPQGQYTLTASDRPGTSNLNVEPNQEIANMVMVKLPANGQLSFYNNSGNVHIYADVAGYYAPGGELFNALSSPDRVLDTRNDASALTQDDMDEVAIRGAGRNEVPANATAVVLNVTAATSTARSYLSVFPGDATLPDPANRTSSLNFKAGEITPNMAVVKLSPTGTINVYNLAGTTDVLVDVFGYFVPASATGSSFTPLDPERMTDTRSLTRIPATGELLMTAVGRSGVPATGVSAVLLNVTAIAPTAQTFITVYPEAPMPATSNLNPRAGVVAVPNLVVARVGSDGRVHMYNHSGTVDLAVDVMGYFSAVS